jgi:hypothetical protein
MLEASIHKIDSTRNSFPGTSRANSRFITRIVPNELDLLRKAIVLNLEFGLKLFEVESVMEGKIIDLQLLIDPCNRISERDKCSFLVLPFRDDINELGSPI